MFGKNPKRIHLPALVGQNARTGEQVPLKDSENAKTMNSKNFVALAL